MAGLIRGAIANAGRARGAIPNAGRPRAPLDGVVVVRGDRSERLGVMSAVLATSDLDIESLEPERKAADAGAFARMCPTLARPRERLVRIRRLIETETVPAAGPPARFDTAMREYWAGLVSDGQRHTREVFVILTAPSPAALDSACGQACDRLAALGVRAIRLAGEGLITAVTDGFEHDTA